MKRILPFLAIAALTIVATSVLAQTSANFNQIWHVLAGGGSPASSANFAANGTLTQAAIGVSQGSSYRAESGYWYGTGTTSSEPPEPPIPVGGFIVPVGKLGLLLPWMGVAALAGLAALGVALVRRRKP